MEYRRTQINTLRIACHDDSLTFKSKRALQMWIKLHKKKCPECNNSQHYKHNFSSNLNTDKYNSVIANKTNSMNTAITEGIYGIV
jgi:hypothetical protein